MSPDHRDPSEMIRVRARQIISSSPPDTVANTVNGEAYGDGAVRSALAAGVFLNPVDPNITVEPMVKRKKGKKAKKSMKQMNSGPGIAKIGPHPQKKVDGLSAPQSMSSKVSKVLWGKPKTKKSRKPTISIG
ncbi:MAG: hypothetical protein Q9178_001998 [Gyalolechia marmorata]